MSRKHKRSVAAEVPSSRWLWFVRILIAAAATGSLYLAWSALGGERLPGCGPESGCDEVLNSRWARLFGIPVSFGALLVYGSLAAATIRIRPGVSPPVQRKLRTLGFFAAVLTLLAAAWFVGLQIFVVGAICPYCMTVHACGSAAALLYLLEFPVIRPHKRPVRSNDNVLLDRPFALRLALGAGLAVALLGLSQSLYDPPSLVTRDLPSGSAPELSSPSPSAVSDGETRDPSKPDGTAPSKTAVARRMLRLHGGMFEFDLDAISVTGSADARRVIVNVFDYTCPHCRVLHGFLNEAQRTFSNELAVVNLPAPLDPACNALVTRHLPLHTNACAYAKIGLAVWRADRIQGEAFDEWIFATPRPPALDQARAQAIGLVGSNAFDKASGDPWIDRQLENNTRLFATNYHLSRISQLPQLMIGTNIVAGNFRRINALYHVLSNHLDLAFPSPSTP